MTWPPQQDPACVQCGKPLGASPSEDFCSDPCQMAWHCKGANHAIVRPRIVRERAPQVPPATWPTLAIPHPDGGVTYARSAEEYQRYLEDTSPAEAPPEPRPPIWRRILGAPRPT